MGCGASYEGQVVHKGSQYPIQAPRTEFKMRNDPRHQQSPLPQYHHQRQQTFIEQQQRQRESQRSLQQQQQQQSPTRQQNWQKPVANVQPQKQVDGKQTSSSPTPRKNVRAVEVTPQILKRYVELELEAREWEAKGVGKAIKLKQEQLQELQDATIELEKKYAAAAKQTEKEKADVDNLKKPESVREFLEDQATYDEQLTKEQEEYLEALNIQELLQKEVEMTSRQCDTLKIEIAAIREDVDAMNRVYREQDELLYSIFQGKYGSELENQLELELDGLCDKKERISMAKTRWHNGLMLLRHAYQQLAFAVNRWKELAVINTTQTAIRWQYATETRNNLLAAQQNITSAQRYLNTIEFPYCKPAEMETLNRAIANIYTDMQSNERHEHANKCYTVTYQRCAALIQWFDAVINKTIKADLVTVTKEVQEKSKALRLERLRLIQDMCADNLGPEVKKILQQAERTSRPHVEEADDDTLAVVPDTVELGEDVIAEIDDAQPPPPSGESHPSVRPVTAPAPMSKDELAPPPSTDDLFGNIEEIKKEHDEKMEEFVKAQDLNKARQEQGLQEKLAARRRRRQAVQ